MSDFDVTILCCPECDSNRAGIIASTPPRATCADCGTIYDIATLPDPSFEASEKKRRKAAPGVRHRRDNGPAELQVEPVPPPTPKQLGTLHVVTEDIIGGGPSALLKTHRRAAKLAHLYGEEFVSQWRLKTPFIEQLESSSAALDISVSHQSGECDPPKSPDSILNMSARNRACARYGMRWRPVFLAHLALSYEITVAARGAQVSPVTVRNHRKADPDFDAQCIAAQEHCISLLHAMSLRSAIEGDCEPVFWQGIQVGHIRKFDNRLRIELLRAHLPKRFQTPGAKAPLVQGDNNKIFIVDAAEQDKLIALRREALEAMSPLRLTDNLASNEARLDSSNSSGDVQ